METRESVKEQSYIELLRQLNLKLLQTEDLVEFYLTNGLGDTVLDSYKDTIYKSLLDIRNLENAIYYQQKAGV